MLQALSILTFAVPIGFVLTAGIVYLLARTTEP